MKRRVRPLGRRSRQSMLYRVEVDTVHVRRIATSPHWHLLMRDFAVARGRPRMSKGSCGLLACRNKALFLVDNCSNGPVVPPLSLYGLPNGTGRRWPLVASYPLYLAVYLFPTLPRAYGRQTHFNSSVLRLHSLGPARCSFNKSK